MSMQFKTFFQRCSLARVWDNPWHFRWQQFDHSPSRALLTRLRQNGSPWAMMLRLNILRTLCGGRGSLTTSLGSASSWLMTGTWGAFSLPDAALGIFLRAPDDAKWGIGQCRSIPKKTKTGGLEGHILKEATEVTEGCLAYNLLKTSWLLDWFPSDLRTLDVTPLIEGYLLSSALCWRAPFNRPLGCDVRAAPLPGGGVSRRQAHVKDTATPREPNTPHTRTTHCGMCTPNPTMKECGPAGDHSTWHPRGRFLRAAVPRPPSLVLPASFIRWAVVLHSHL